MSEEDIRDPRAVPRWLPVGIHGVPRAREWDAVLALELPELADRPETEIVLRRLPGGCLVAAGGSALPGPAARRLESELARAIDGPCEALLVRRGVAEWSLAARVARLDVIDLPEHLEVDELAVALTPDGERSVFVDGERVKPSGVIADAALLLEAAGLREHRAFVARARRTAVGWSRTVDPL